MVVTVAHDALLTTDEFAGARRPASDTAESVATRARTDGTAAPSLDHHPPGWSDC